MISKQKLGVRPLSATFGLERDPRFFIFAFGSGSNPSPSSLWRRPGKTSAAGLVERQILHRAVASAELLRCRLGEASLHCNNRLEAIGIA
jgi:hypothetical protein